MSIFHFRERDGTINVGVNGYLPKEPKVLEKVVLFSVCYGKDKYMDCKAWASDTAGRVAACLERHDYVAVDGIYETYTGKDGKEHSQVVVDGIFVMAEPVASTYAEPAPSGTSSSSSFAELTEDDGELPF